jgi:hypothetical protein
VVEELWNGDSPSIEFLILAESAEAIHGKLYLMGGAWETIHIARFDVPVTLTIAVSVQVPWNATNRQYALGVSVLTADGAMLARQDRQLMTGRPAHVEPGTSQRTLFVLSLPVELPKPDRYVVVATIDEIALARVSFRAHPDHAHT